MNTSSIEERYKEFKIELKICKIGGLFLALYCNKEVPKLIMTLLKNDADLEDFFQFPLDMDEKKVPFPILFEQTFEQMGKKSNIYHILGIKENLSSEVAKEFLGYLQYARERLKAKHYSLVFWITSDFEKELFFQAPDFHHWVFGTYDFTDIDGDELNKLTPSVNKELFDVQKIDQYFKKVVWQYQNWETVKKNKESFLLELMERADLYNYYIDCYCIDQEGKTHLLDDLLANFIEDSQQNFLTLLGDFGTGKSSFSIHYFIELAQKHLDNHTKRIPIFISLKDYTGKLNIENFMVTEFYEKFNIEINFSIFQQLALQGKFIFFIDGFDEMASLIDTETTFQNLKELTKLSFENVLFMTKAKYPTYKANKVFLTSRTHYFLSESQEQDILRADYTILSRNYATKSNYEITRIKLKELNDNQIRKYIQKHTNSEEITKQYFQIIEDTYNLKELSTRPLLLEMIIKTMPILREKNNINPAALYRSYTNFWIERDDWRSQMYSQGKRSFICEMAVKMFQLSGDFSLHYSKLDQPKNEHLKSNFKISNQDYYKYESTTCAFLNRDSSGNYKFIHKSFMEYFFAESFYSHLKKDNIQIFNYLSLNTEIKFFLKYIISLQKDELDGLDLGSFNLCQVNLSSGSLNQSKLIGTNLENANLENAKLIGTNLRGANLENAKLIGTNLENANLSGVSLVRANLRGANLENAKLIGTNLVRANLENTNLENANLVRANLENTNLENANLVRANLENTNLENANLSEANLSEANLSEAYLSGANLSGANLSGANLSGANLEKTYLSEAYLSEAKLQGTYLSGANLSGANLEKTYLVIANLSGAKLQGTYLSGANLSGVKLSEANLENANLSGAYLEEANLENANLSGANLENALLIGTNLSGANLENANLSGANLYQTKSLNIKHLKSAKNWEKAVYTELKWDYNHYKWVFKDKEQANEAKIQEIRNSNGIIQF